jgi:choline dehydrogenase
MEVNNIFGKLKTEKLTTVVRPTCSNISFQLENDHTVPKGTPGHGFNGFLDISGNDDSFLKNQSQALALLQATAAEFGEDPTRIWNLLHRDINNASPDRDQQVGIFEAPTT